MLYKNSQRTQDVLKRLKDIFCALWMSKRRLILCSLGNVLRIGGKVVCNLHISVLEIEGSLLARRHGRVAQLKIGHTLGYSWPNLVVAVTRPISQ